MNVKYRFWRPLHLGCAAGSAIVVALLVASNAAFAQTGIPDAVLDIMDESCATSGCHAGPNARKGLDLTAETLYQAVVNVPSRDVPTLKLVQPGNPQQSYLFLKMVGGEGMKGKRMPRGNSTLTAQQIQVVADWISSIPTGASKADARKTYAEAFESWSSANLPTTATVPKGAFMYRIAHRFNSPVDAGFDELLGLDGGAAMMTQVAFPLSNDLTASISRSKINATFELAAKWRLMREKTDGSVPFSAAVLAGVDWATEGDLYDPDAPAEKMSRTAGERFGLFVQAPLSKTLGPKLSVMAVPGVLLNGNVGKSGEAALVSLGLAGKLNLSTKYALFAEFVPILTGAEDAAVIGGVLNENEAGEQIFYDSFTAGVEIAIGGHVFHVFVSNSAGNTTNQYMSGGNFDFFNGDMRIGFNIYRLLNYPF